VEEEQRKWFLFSRTTWFNAISMLVLPLILTAGDMKEVAGVLGVERLRELIISLPPVFNIGLRLITWGAVGRERGGRPWYLSKMVWFNLLMIIFCGWLAYRLIDAGASLKVPIALILVGIINIYLRITHTTRRLTLLPGPLGKIA
jgi:hypothetical protein